MPAPKRDDTHHDEDHKKLRTPNATAINLTHVFNATMTNAVCDDSDSEYTMMNTMFMMFSELLLDEMFEACGEGMDVEKFTQMYVAPTSVTWSAWAVFVVA